MAPKLTPLPDGLSPLEQALVETLRSGHADFVKELRAFRWQMMALIVFLVAIVATLAGANPLDASKATQQVLSPLPALPTEP